MFRETLIVALSGLCLTGFLYFCFQQATSRLPAAPGPFFARFTRLWYLRALIRGDFELVNIDLHRKYGKIVRLEPNLYSIDDPEALMVIYNTAAPWSKSKWYWAASPPGTHTNFTTPDNKDAARYRRNFAPVFSMTSLLAHEPLIDDCTNILLEKLKGFAKSGETIDLSHWLTCWAFDCQGHITFSQRFGFLDKGEDIGGICESLVGRLQYSTLMGVFPELHSTAWAIVNWFAGGGTGKVDYTIDYTLKRIAERKAEEKPQKQDMLNKFLEGQRKDPQHFTDWHVMVGTFGNIVAGADTTWITLSAILYYLIKNPECLDKLRAEVDGMVKAGTISDPVTFHESQAMPYVQAVIKEGQRMFPATALPLFRIVPEGGALIAGKHFPAGAVVGINNWVAHRNKDVFGPDADVFRPERWLEGDTAVMNRYYIPFGAGPRTCQGLHVAEMEMSKVVPQLVRYLDFQMMGEWKTKNRWLILTKDFNCRVKLRE